jgi:uncharacterized membrane protein YgdD (TMEM256/DUF423 family)
LLNFHERIRLLDVASWAMVVVILLLPGFLRAWLPGGREFFIYPIPAGRTSFIIGWLAVAGRALALWRKN